MCSTTLVKVTIVNLPEALPANGSSGGAKTCGRAILRSLLLTVLKISKLLDVTECSSVEMSYETPYSYNSAVSMCSWS